MSHTNKIICVIPLGSNNILSFFVNVSKFPISFNSGNHIATKIPNPIPHRRKKYITIQINKPTQPFFSIIISCFINDKHTSIY